jgi:hypothetical protein
MANRTAEPGEINWPPFDRFTLGHLAVGIMLGLIRMPWWGAGTFAVGWEIVERPMKDNFPGLFPHATQDTLPNAVVDAAAMMVGWGIIQLFPKDVKGWLRP